MSLQVNIFNIVSTYLVEEKIMIFVRQHKNGTLPFDLINVSSFILDGIIIQLKIVKHTIVQRNEGEEGENKTTYTFEVDSREFNSNYLEYQ